MLLDLAFGLAMAAWFHFSSGRKRLGNTIVPAWRESCRSHSFICMSTSGRPCASAGASGGLGRVASRYSNVQIKAGEA
jgi:hypothetical protein